VWGRINCGNIICQFLGGDNKQWLRQTGKNRRGVEKAIQHTNYGRERREEGHIMCNGYSKVHRKGREWTG